ncbi:MAG: diacylglycerol kinase [Hyphomicrobiales bacterium]|nr:diacylglycerol kinase [Hyphomicrobiales bacterium]
MPDPQNHSRDSKPGDGASPQPSALPGRGGIARIIAASRNTASGLYEGLTSEAAIRQEFAIVCLAVPLSFFLAQDLWSWVALMASLMLLLAIEFLNTAIERLCDYVQPEKHEQIRITKDLASAGVFFGLLLCGLVWGAALVGRLFGVG